MSKSSPERWVRSAAAAAIGLASLTIVQAVSPADVAQAAGTPDIELTKSMPAEVLYGADVPVSLTIANPDGPDGFNALFTDILPEGASYVTGSGSPAPTSVTLLDDDTTLLVWNNVADSLQGTEVSISYDMAIDDAFFAAGDTVTNSANAFVHSDPRTVPKSDGLGGALAPSFTGNDDASATTELVPFELTKEGGTTEDELLRGVHDQQTVYTLTVDNNFVNSTTGFVLVDFLPAQLEFLGCNPITDNTTVGDEYDGSGPIPAGPATPNCAEPSSVTTVDLDPDGGGPMPSAVYTRVEWNAAAIAASAAGSADLGPGGSFTIEYITAIPLRENVLLDPDLALPTANLDNNTGPLTTETAGETTLMNYATAAGFYNGEVVPTVDDDIDEATIEDISIHKSVDDANFDQASTPVFTLLVESSEYALATGPITVTDTIPAVLDFDAGNTTPAPAGGPVLNADGTETYTWTLPAFTGPNSSATITVATTVREFYRNGDGSNGAPVASNDAAINTTDLTADVDVITDPTGPATTTVSLTDASEAGVTSGGPSISKDVSVPLVGPGTLTCANGAGIVFDPTSAGLYRPGDRVCFRLAVDFPTELDTISPLVDDFLPDGFAFESFAFGAGNDVATGDVVFSEDSPRLRWDLTDIDRGGQRFEVVIQTIISEPSGFEPADIADNLMKVRYSNVSGGVFQFRDEALAELGEAVLDLDKGVIELNGSAVTGAPADGVTVQGGDVVTYQVAVSNIGNEDAFDASVRDVLPAGITCADVDLGSISNGGACDAANGWIQWETDDDIDVAPGATVNLTYDVTIPDDVVAGTSYVNEAGVREYTGETNSGTPFTYVPADNIDPTLTPNTEPADDTAEVSAALPNIDKTRTTSVTAAGNAANNQATIGETVSYTVDLELSGGTTYFEGVFTDDLGSEKDLDESTVAVTRDGVALVSSGTPSASGFVLDTSGNSIALTFPASYVVPRGASQDFEFTFDVVVTDVSSNVRTTGSTNRADFDFENAAGDGRNVNDSVGLQIVEPNVVLGKANDTAAGVAGAGETITYQLDVTNDDVGENRVSTAYETVVVDTVPPELIVQTGTISNGGVFAAGATANDPSTITWNIATIDPGDTVALTYDVVTATPLVATGTLVNTAVATTTSMPGDVAGERTSTSPNGDEIGDGYTDPASSSVTVPPLALSKTADPTTATIGEPVTYTVGVTIPGGLIAYDVTVVDDIPPGVAYESLTSIACVEDGGTCSPDIAIGDADVIAPSTGDGDDIAFFFGDFTTSAADDRVVTITYVAVVTDETAADDGSTLTNGATVNWNRSDQITDTPTAVPDTDDFDETSPVGSDDVDTVEPSLSLNKDVAGQNGDDDTRRAVPGETLSYTVTVTNNGSGPAYDVVVSDVPTDETWLPFVDTTVDGSITNTDSNPVGGLEWTIPGPIAASGGTATITYTLTVPAGFDSSDENVAGAEQSNRADVSSYFGVAEVIRDANPDRDYRDYDDVVADVVTIELDLASIGDLVWYDVDGDGVVDPGEPGIANVDVLVTYLGPDNTFGTADDETFPASTDADGIYLIEDLPGGQYVVDVDESDPQFIDGLEPSFDLDGGVVAPDGASSASLGEDQDRRDVDFGYTGTGSIGDTIWLDQNLNDVQDPGEDGIGGVDVTVTWGGPDDTLGTGDDIVFTTTTDVDGNYLVDNLPAGEYSVVVDTDDLPADYDNVFDPDDGIANESELTLGDGEDRLDQDFGYAGTLSLGDTVYLDQNGDGDQDGGEPGLVGITVELVHFGPDGLAGGGDDSFFTTVTGANGQYRFDNLVDGNYEVTVVGGVTQIDNTDDPDLPGSPDAGDSMSSVTLSGSDDFDQDFGYNAVSVLGDRVWWDRNGDGVQDPDEPGLSGVEIEITAPGLGAPFTTTTDENGDYLFINIANSSVVGDYTVTVLSGVPDGFTQTYDADAVNGDPVVLDDTSVVTLADADLVQDFGYNGAGSIGDTIWFDLDSSGGGAPNGDEFGLTGVTVTLTWVDPDGNPGTDDDIVLTTTTDANGNYLFDNLANGDYIVDVDETTLPPDLQETYDRDGELDGQGTTSVTLTDGDNVELDVDFGYAGTGSIGDTVWFDRNGDGVFDADEYPLSGVDVVLTFDFNGNPQTITATTDADGLYLFPNLPPGEYVVTVDVGTLPAGMSPTFDGDADTNGLGNTSTVSLAIDEDDLDQDFGYRGLGSIGDTVYLDLDGDGVQDLGEPGVVGQTVVLGWDGPAGRVTFTTTTDSAGNYLFDGLPEGDYDVTVLGGIADDAVNTGDPSVVGPTVGDSTNALTLTAGEPDDLDQDFGYQGVNSIGDTVWFDVAGDGVRDPGDDGIEGIDVTVVWFGSDGVEGGGDDVAFPSATTDGGGQYLVSNLPDGNFSVTVTGGLAPGSDTNTFDGDDGATNPDGTSIVTGLGVGDADPVSDLDQDFGYTGSASVGDTIWLDLDADGVQDVGEPGIAGVQVTLTGAGADGVLGTVDDIVYPTQTTGPDGRYLFGDLPAGPVQIDVANPVPGLTLTADPQGLVDGSSTITLSAGETDLDQDFGYRGDASIGDTVFFDLDADGVEDIGEPGVPGVNVTVTSSGLDGVLGTADDIVVSVQTDADGTYLVENLPAGPTSVSYDAADLPTGQVPDSDVDDGDPTVSTVTLGAAEDRRDVDFGVVGDATISGVVWQDNDADGTQDSGEPGIGGVTVEVTFDGPTGPIVFTVVTDSDGTWSIDSVPPGDYTTAVVESSLPPGLVATTPIDVDTVVPPGGEGRTSNGFVPGGSIGDTVFNDSNGNGVQDPGEPGVPGVTIVLTDGDGDTVSVVTDRDGGYRFDGLPPDTYTVTVVESSLPPGVFINVDRDGTPDGTTRVGLGIGQDIDDVDFGVRSTASLPQTGRTILQTLTVAGVLLAAGWVLFGITRRRRPTA